MIGIHALFGAFLAGAIMPEIHDLNTRGLMELIALNIGYDLGILSPRISTILVIMALAATMLTGPLLTLFGRQRAAANGVGEPSRT